MKLLIVTATAGELLPLPTTRKEHGWEIDTLVTGVGTIATTYALTKKLQSTQYDLVLQVGVGGSFDKNIPLGDVVFITSEQYGDTGAEDHDKFIDIFEMGLIEKDTAPHTGGRLLTPLTDIHNKIDLPQVAGLTVNTVSGNVHTILRREELYGCQVESMEGAAFHYVCLQEGVCFAQVRSISNYVTPRDKSQWRMKDAIINLNKWLIDFINIL